MTSQAAEPRVAMLIQGYFPHVGGAERQLATLAPALLERGLDVHVLTRRARGRERFEEIRGVPVHRIATPGSRITKSISFTLGAQLMLRRLDPDVIHAHDLYSPTTTALLAKRRLGVPVVVKVPRGGHLGDVARIRGRSFGRRRLEWLRDRVDRFVVISEEIDGELAAIGVPPERRIAIPNGVDTERFAPTTPEARTELRRTLEIAGSPLIVYAGRLEPEKRLPDLFEVWPRVLDQHPEASLVIVGSGEQAAMLEREAGERVHFTGAALDVAPYMRAGDLFVLPSAAEGLSNSLLEAMASALPVVATSVGAAPEVIENRKSGWLVPAADPPSLLEAILAALAEPAASRAVGACARERVVSRYSLPVVADRFRELYRDVLKR